jgi:putative FmdB family regulatory protein
VPIYEYECQACGKAFETFLGFNDKQPTKCVNCKSSRIRKLVSNCSFQLKGTGWYLTDYARKDKDNGGKGKKQEAGGQASESTKAAESSATSESKDTAKASESKDTAKPADTSSAKNAGQAA